MTREAKLRVEQHPPESFLIVWIPLGLKWTGLWAVGRGGKRSCSGSWVRCEARLLSCVLGVLCAVFARCLVTERMELHSPWLIQGRILQCLLGADQALLRFSALALMLARDLYWWTICYEQVLETPFSYWAGERRAKLFSSYSSDFTEYISVKSSYAGCQRRDFAALNLTRPLPACCMGWWGAPAISLLSFFGFQWTAKYWLKPSK